MSIPSIILACLAALPAAAQESPWYIGLSAGQSTTDSALYENRQLPVRTSAPNSPNRGVFDVRSSFDEKDKAVRAVVGFRFNPHIAVEGVYADYGTTRASWLANRFNAQLIEPIDLAVDRSVKGFGADIVASLPVFNRLSLLGRVGYFRAETKAVTSTNVEPLVVTGPFFIDGEDGKSRSAKTTEGVAKFGLGVEWAFTGNLSARLEWERLANVGRKFDSPPSTQDTGRADLDAWTLGVLWRF